MLVAAVLGLLFAGGLALVREIFVDQFRRAEDVEDRLGLPVLGLTPYVDSDEIDPQDVNQFSSLMEAYASIRSTIDVAVPRDGAAVQLTSSGPSEGKSTTALILSELFARLGRRTLLIDADFRKPSIVKLLELEPRDIGIAEVILGHAEFDQAVIQGCAREPARPLHCHGAAQPGRAAVLQAVPRVHRGAAPELFADHDRHQPGARTGGRAGNRTGGRFDDLRYRSQQDELQPVQDCPAAPEQRGSQRDRGRS